MVKIFLKCSSTLFRLGTSNNKQLSLRMTTEPSFQNFTYSNNDTIFTTEDSKDGLSSIEIHFIIVAALAVLCFSLALANILVHYYVKGRRGYQAERNRRNLATIIAQIERYNKKESMKTGPAKSTQMLFAKNEHS